MLYYDLYYNIVCRNNYYILIQFKIQDLMVYRKAQYIVYTSGSKSGCRYRSGLCVFEPHRDPEKALCDSSSQLHIDKLEDLLKI